MRWRFVQWEAMRLLGERAARGAVLVMGLACAAAIALGGSRVAEERASRDAIETAEAQRYQRTVAALSHPSAEKNSWADPSSPGAAGFSDCVRAAILPVGRLGVLAVGQRDAMPTAVGVSLKLDPFTERYDRIENPRHIALGSLDLAFVLLTLLPLLILVLTYDLVSGDREHGTLLLLLGQQTPFSQILLVRVAVRAAAVGLLCLAAILASTAASHAPADAATALAVLGATAAVWAYASFWFALALAVQRLNRSSQTNALLALATWLLLVVVLPAALETFVDVAVPVPSRVSLFEASRRAQREATAKEDQALAAFYGDHPQLAAADDGLDSFWKHWVIRTRETERALLPLLTRFDAQVGRRQELIAVLSALTPAVAMGDALSTLAGADGERHHRYVLQVQAFSREYRRFFEDRVLRGQRLTAEDLVHVPRFAFREEAPAQSLRRLSCDVVQIIAPTGLLLLLALFRFRRVKWLEEAT